MITKRQAAQNAQRREALAVFLKQSKTKPDPESLSRSYGLPVSEVQRILKGV